MAESPATTEPNPQQSEPSNPPQPNQLDPAPQLSSSTSLPLNPIPPPPPSIIQVSSVLPTAPSFRLATPPIPVPSAPQFSPLPMPNLPNPRIQNPTVQPPGVAAVAPPPMMQPYASFGNPVLRHYMPMPNGYSTQGTLPPPGIPRYPSPFTPMVRPTFPPRPPGVIGIIPPFLRPPIPGIRGPIIITPVVRPAVVPSVTPTEKPQTTVYVGKIASTVESDFVLSLLQLCGPVKNWKRAHDPTNGSPKGFGFCEFESADGVLRALRLLSKLNVDGQELVINVTQATREYLQCYVEKKAENSKKLKEIEAEEADKKEETAQSAEKSEAPTPSVEDSRKDEDSGSQENSDSANFGIVTDEDREADQEALDKLRVMIEDRLKNNPLPPPPPPPLTAADGSGNSNSEQPARSKDGDSDMNAMRDDAAGGDKNEDEMTSDSKPTSEHDRPETSSPDRSKKYDRRVRDRERDSKREKEKELERNEKERGQERARREREREYKNRDDDRRYRARVEEWEYREREKEKLRKQEKEKEKDRENKRKREIMDQEHENDEVDSKRRKHESVSERKRRLREKEEDLADRQREEEEAAEAKRRADEELQQRKQQEKDAMEIYPGPETIGSNKGELHDESNVGSKDKAVEETYDGDSGHGDDIGVGIIHNGNEDESVMESIAASDIRQNRDATAKKLGFGLVGSGKRTAVPSVFDEEDEDAQKEKKMRPLVPIDYSTEELQAVHSAISDAPSSNLAVAAEFAKRISGVIPREERPDAEKERSRRSHDRYRQRDRDRDRNDDESHETNRTRNEGRKESFERARDRELVLDKVKTADNQKLLDAKQLIDMIPKTKDELFSYEINWDVYDKNELHDRMRPWISKKIKEFLGEEETSLVDYIVSTTLEHVKASIMLERLQAILDDEAEMFVLKMWRMLIFEIKKIETGLALRSKT